MNHAPSPPRRDSAPCFDAGSICCPCDLAFLGQCVACSLIRGESVCRCGWSGLCVYQEFVRRKEAAPPRREIPARVAGLTGLPASPGQKEAFILDLVVGDSVARWCVFPGSFLMVRPKGRSSRFNVPLSVMQVRDDAIQVAVEVVGPKTAALAAACVPDAGVIAAGPYWSGLQGSAALSSSGAGRVLVVAKGIGQAPAVNTAKYALGRGAFVKTLLGPGGLGEVFVDGLLRDEGAAVEVLPRSRDHNMARVYQELCTGGYDVLVSEGGDRQHRSLLDLCASLDSPPAFAWSSNLTMTCAEGICGSCLVNGRRGCKARLDAAEVPAPRDRAHPGGIFGEKTSS